MNRHEYERELELLKSECPCPELSRLYQEREEVETALTAMKHFSHLDVKNPLPSQLTEFKEYGLTREEYGRKVDEYYRTLENEIQKGNINLKAHSIGEINDIKDLQVEDVSYEKARALFDEASIDEWNFPIITAHCTRCTNLVDLVSYLS